MGSEKWETTGDFGARFWVCGAGGGDPRKQEIAFAQTYFAIALQTGRANDKARLLQFIESGTLDAATLKDILTRHVLTERWAQFQRQFLSDTP